MKEAEEAFMEALAIYTEFAKREPIAFGHYVLGVQKNLDGLRA
jgi:hypothetical protein